MRISVDSAQSTKTGKICPVWAVSDLTGRVGHRKGERSAAPAIPGKGRRSGGRASAAGREAGRRRAALRAARASHGRFGRAGDDARRARPAALEVRGEEEPALRRRPLPPLDAGEDLVDLAGVRADAAVADPELGAVVEHVAPDRRDHRRGAEAAGLGDGARADVVEELLDRDAGLPRPRTPRWRSPELEHRLGGDGAEDGLGEGGDDELARAGDVEVVHRPGLLDVRVGHVEEEDLAGVVLVGHVAGHERRGVVPAGLEGAGAARARRGGSGG